MSRPEILFPLFTELTTLALICAMRDMVLDATAVR